MGRKRRGNGEGAIYQRADGRWCAAISLGYDAQGKLKRRTIYGKSKTEVKDKLLKLQHDSMRGKLVEPSKLTVGQHFENWLMQKKRNTKANTLSKYANHVKKHIIPSIGHIKLTELNYLHINAFYTELEAKVRKDGRPRLSATTRTDIARVLAQGLNDAIKKGLIFENPVHKVEGPQYDDKEAAYLTPKEWVAFRRAIRGERLEDLFILGLHTGLRPSELLGLPWENVNLEKETIRVAQAVHEDGGNIWIGELKSASSYRTISIGKRAIAALKRQRLRQIQARLKAGPKWTPPQVDKPFSGNLVFTTDTGGWIRRSTIYKHDLARIRRRSGLHDVGLHTMRHSHVAVLIGMGANQLQIKERMGHKDVGFTLDKYGHLWPKDDEKAARLMDAFEAQCLDEGEESG